jgi:hypothetical protein
MAQAALRHRLATRDDVPALTGLMAAAITELQKPFLEARPDWGYGSGAGRRAQGAGRRAQGSLHP